MEGHHSGSSKFDEDGLLSPTMRDQMVKKIGDTSVGDLVQSKFVIYGPALSVEDNGVSYGPGPNYQGIGTSSPSIYSALLDELYGGTTVTVERGALGIVTDIGTFNVNIHWLPRGPKWWVFPEEYDVISRNRENCSRISGSH